MAPPTYSHEQPELLEEFLEEIQFHVESVPAVTEVMKRSMLMSALDATTKRSLREWFSPTALTDKDVTFAALTCKLKEKISPTINRLVYYSRFVRRVQQEDEEAASFMASLQRLAVGCGFGTAEKTLTLYQFAYGIRDRGLQAKVLLEHENITAARALEIVQAGEKSVSCVREVRGEQEDEVEVVHALRSKGYTSPKVNTPKVNAPKVSMPKVIEPKASPRDGESFHCGRCGEGHRTRECDQVPKSLWCPRCKITGHVLKACRKKRLEDAAQGTSRAGEGQNCVTERQSVQEVADGESLEDLFYVLATGPEPESDEVVKPAEVLKLDINGFTVGFEVDCGASRTIVDLATFSRLFPRGEATVFPAGVTLQSYEASEALELLGKVYVQVKHRSYEGILPLIVSKGSGPNLVGRNWFEALGISVSGIYHVSSQEQQMDNPEESIAEAASKMPAVTGVGTGCYKGPPLHLDPAPDVTPKYQRARRVAFSLTTRMSEAIRENVRRGIWVPMRYAGKWASPIVPVKKKNLKLRLCADYKGTVNKALSCDSYLTPSTEEVLTRLGQGNTVFAEIDLKDAYTQLPLDQATSELLAVNTVEGIFRPTRLPFGVKVAPPAFQRVIDALLQWILGLVAYQGNVYIGAPNKALLKQRVLQALRALGDAGLQVNAEKCVWEATALNVLGFRVSAQGVQPLEDKVRAIQQAPAPKNKAELQSLLGLISFYSRFLKDKATILEPLHGLLDKEESFQWTKKHERALREVKDRISSDVVLMHYSSTLPLVVLCDASPVGVGAVLAHRVLVPGTKDKYEDRPVHCASRTLASAERNYSQTDREALALIFALKKFRQYLVGRKFTLVTDHKPLVGMFKGGQQIDDKHSPRIIRWGLLLASFDCDIQYRPGALMGCPDFLSRHPVDEPPTTEEVPAGIHLLETKEGAPLTAEEVRKATTADRSLQQIMEWVRSGWPAEVPEHAKPFYNRREGLSVVGSCLLWRDRVVIPEAVRQEVLGMVHATHQGETYSKSIARSIAWWPNIDRDIVATVKACEKCQRTAALPSKRVITPWPPASEPWERLHMDYAGPVQGYLFLIVVDSFSKWPVVKVVQNLTASTLIRHVRNIFSDFGRPHVVVTDNGRQFVSQEFNQFLTTNGVRHVTTPPYHPASNGQAERTVQTFKKMFLKFTDGDVHARVARCLWAMRITPLAATNKTPAQLMGRKFRTLVTQLHPANVPEKTAIQTAPGYRVGTCVWVLKHRQLNKVTWEPGVLVANRGNSACDVQMNSGEILYKLSVDFIRIRMDEDPTYGTVPDVTEIQHDPSQSLVNRPGPPAVPQVTARPPPETEEQSMQQPLEAAQSQVGADLPSQTAAEVLQDAAAGPQPAVMSTDVGVEPTDVGSTGPTLHGGEPVMVQEGPLIAPEKDVKEAEPTACPVVVVSQDNALASTSATGPLGSEENPVPVSLLNPTPAPSSSEANASGENLEPLYGFPDAQSTPLDQSPVGEVSASTSSSSLSSRGRSIYRGTAAVVTPGGSGQLESPVPETGKGRGRPRGAKNRVVGRRDGPVLLKTGRISIPSKR